MTTPNKTVPVPAVPRHFSRRCARLGSVRYMFANTGTDHGPLIEAMARTASEDPRDIRPIVVPHEQAAVSMAHGYYNVTQEPQMVLVHTLPGTANALGGIINAASANVPLFLCAGRTPITEGELRGGKSQNIHWRQESRDQGGVVREFVKWDYEIRTNQNLAAVVSRAYKIAMSEPRGPVYMTLPREWLAEALESTAGVCAGCAGAGEQDASRPSVAGKNRRLADRLGKSLDRHQISRPQSRSGAVVDRAERVAGDPGCPANDLRQLPHRPSDASRHPGDQVCSQRRCVVFHRHRRAVGAAQPQRLARRRQDRSPGARSAVHRHSRLGFPRRPAGERLFGSVAAGADCDHPQQS